MTRPKCRHCGGERQPAKAVAAMARATVQEHAERVNASAPDDAGWAGTSAQTWAYESGRLRARLELVAGYLEGRCIACALRA